MRLAKVELSEKLSDVGRHAAMIAAAAVFGLAALMAVTAGNRAAADRARGDPVAGGGDHRGGDGPGGLPARAVRHRGAAQEEPSRPSKPCIPSRRRPSGSRTKRGRRSNETAEIKREIERTRVEMSETIGEIQDRLSPDHLLQQAKDGVKDAAAGKARSIMNSAGETAATVAYQARGVGDSLASYVRQHPLQVALTVGAVTWLMLRSRDQSAGLVRHVGHVVGGRGRAVAYGDGRSLRSRVGEYASTARETVGEYASTARETVGEYASTARETVGEYASSARETAGEYAVVRARARPPRRRDARAARPATPRRRADDYRAGESARGRRHCAGRRRRHRPGGAGHRDREPHDGRGS